MTQPSRSGFPRVRSKRWNIGPKRGRLAALKRCASSSTMGCAVTTWRTGGSGGECMTDLRGYARRIEEEDLPRLRQSLAPLESGQMRLGSRSEGETEWRDVTAEHVAMLKRAVGTYEAILDRLR